MFRKEVKNLGSVLTEYLRAQGLETPLLQTHLINAWDRVVGPSVAQYTQEKFIQNQILCVKIVNPALRQDLSMMRTKLVQKLNQAAGSQIITDIRIY